MEILLERRHPRVCVPLTVVLDCMSGRREVRVADLGAGGCYVDTLTGVVPKETVGLTFLLQEGTTMALSGTVAYVHPGIGFGVEFTSLTSEQRLFIARIIAAS